MIEIIVNTSNATESEIEELNKIIPFSREKFHFDKNNIKVKFITKQDVEMIIANIDLNREIKISKEAAANILTCNSNFYLFYNNRSL